MLFDWVRGIFKDDFERFYVRVKEIIRRVERLRRFDQISQYDRSRVLEIRKHLIRMQRESARLGEVLAKEAGWLQRVSDLSQKKKMEDNDRLQKNILLYFEGCVNSGKNVSETIICGVTDEQVKQRLREILISLPDILEKLLRVAERQINLEKSWKSVVKQVHNKPISRILLVGRLNNGWTLTKIRGVILDLGGSVEPTGGGTHPYKIVFNGKRPIPLGPSTPPEMLLEEVHDETGINRQVLRFSFAHGKLITG